MSHAKSYANAFNLEHIGWKYYNTIKKKAVEQEFSWSGLVISLSIAFFIVVACAQGLNLIYESVINKNYDSILKEKIYRLEKSGLNSAVLEAIKDTFAIQTAYAATVLNYQGSISKWTDNINLKAGETVSYTVKIKNTGKKVWKKNEVTLETGPYLRSFSKVKNSSWLNYYTPAKLGKDTKPGETSSITFKLLAPNGINGGIQENFQLVYNEQPITGTNLRLQIEISDDSATAVVNNQTASAQTITITKPIINQTVTVNKNEFCIALTETEKLDHTECQTNLVENDTSNGISQSTALLDQEPIIRIGLYNTTAAQRITCDKYFDVYAGSNIILSGLSPKSVVTVSYDFANKQYGVSTSAVSRFSSNYIKFVPREKNGVMQLIDFDSRPKWNTSLNDNLFRNNIEFHYSDATSKLWVINELPIENYLKGMAETSNYSPVEYQKTIITAARTYAMYHYNRGIEYNVSDGSTKHGDEHFHLDATYDQVYRGYNSEIRLSKLAQAINETRGVVIAYDNKVVVTPYYSNSDGRSRAWEEVWYGDKKPWLVSVAIPEDVGQTLWGHGVGMSARAALIMTRDEGKSWKDTLKYFYQSTNLLQIYK